MCFGTITTYEYQLPAGWSLGGVISTGSNWIPGSNSVTVTSDGETGSGLAVKVRPRNSCGAGMTNNQSITEIPISRPNPSMSITGASTICSGNNYTYTLNGVPTGATIAWRANSYYQITGSGTSVTISPFSSSNGSTTVIADVTLPNCSILVPVSTTISMGAPYVTFNIVGYPYPDPSCYGVWGIYSFQAQQASGYPNSFTGYQWGWRNLTNNTVSSDPTIYGSSYSFISESAGNYEIWVRATNGCGVGTLESVKTVTVDEICGGGLRSMQDNLNVYPNPSKNKITVEIPSAFRKEGVLQVIDPFGQMVFTKKVNIDGETLDVDITRFKEGIYQVNLRAGKLLKQAKIVKR